MGGLCAVIEPGSPRATDKGGRPAPALETPIRLHEGALPRSGEEQRADRDAVRAREPVLGATKFARRGTGASVRDQKTDPGAQTPIHLLACHGIFAIPDTGSFRPSLAPHR
jgi:hypothetical protein